ncbi:MULTISPECIES: hypothetical protein [Microcystis]|uniref:hypothetical protein n=1 Tax=Microcystis TaxID=1125 RepID=UPI00086E3897|nr:MULTISPECIES: hypothetical protein [Microcystis]ODV36477.1 hypothetical protein BFG60_4079 [Microcystis aeruginosa NIES-98]
MKQPYPNCPYSPSSTTGCLIYVKTYPVTDTTARFVVGDDFQEPEATIYGIEGRT